MITWDEMKAATVAAQIDDFYAERVARQWDNGADFASTISPPDIKDQVRAALFAAGLLRPKGLAEEVLDEGVVEFPVLIGDHPRKKWVLLHTEWVRKKVRSIVAEEEPGGETVEEKTSLGGVTTYETVDLGPSRPAKLYNGPEVEVLDLCKVEVEKGEVKVFYGHFLGLPPEQVELPTRFGGRR